MKSVENSDKKKHKKYLRVPALILLALVCVAGVELAVCSVMDPALFRRITQPAVELLQTIREGGASLAERALSALGSEEDGEQSQPLPVSQQVQEPKGDQTQLIQDPKATRFATRQGYEVLTGGAVELIYFNQGEEPWADAPFGSDPISGYGCGPTAMSMVVSTLGTEVTDPEQMAKIACNEGYWAPGSGSYLSIVQGLGQLFSLEVQPCGDITADELCQLLASGNLLVALMGPGHFTNGGHFIVLRGLALTGEVLVADPNSRERSLALWDPQMILDELSASRANGAPLWSFSTLKNGRELG